MCPPYFIQSTIDQWNVAGQHVILRADLNVPIEDNIILNDFRLTAFLPTLALLCDKGAYTHIITHRGSPQHATSSTSTTPLIAWFNNAGYKTPYVHLHENLRFSAAEKTHNLAFAHALARGMNWYVNDAFASLHRSDTSLTVLPQLFPLSHRSIGLLVQRELEHLSPLIQHPHRPYGMILGGGKITTKLPYFVSLLDRVDYIFVCPGLSSIFIQSQKQQFSHELQEIRDSLASCQHYAKIILPADYLVRSRTSCQQYYKCAHEITADDILIAIGPQTVREWLPRLSSLKTIVCNGPMGYENEPKTRTSLHELLQCIAQLNAYTVIGGGDMILAAESIRKNLPAGNFSWLSTGGGSLLALLSGSPLPALEALHESHLTST